MRVDRPQFIYCQPWAVNASENMHVPGIAMFSRFTDIYGKWVLPIDRTGTIRTPVRTVSLFPMPALRPQPKSYEVICNERAREVLNKADILDRDLFVFYSGGIDSTCVVVSLLKNATPTQKKRIVVLLSQESIMENPRFFEEHIRGKLRVESSTLFPYLLGRDHFILSGENNDQVMGSDKTAKLIEMFGEEAIHQPYKRETFEQVFGSSLGHEPKATAFYLDLFERLKRAAPMELRTNFEYLWWINFCLKWQAVFAYTLMFTPPRNTSRVTKEYITSHFTSFYNTEDFQLWSMNNLDKRIKDTWLTYKWVSKEVIYDYTKDAEYRDNKTKKGSRGFITRKNSCYNFLDENLMYHMELPPETYIEPVNDFVVGR
jgi:hypothetical protein